MNWADLIKLNLERQKLAFQIADERFRFEADRMANELVRKAQTWSFKLTYRRVPWA